MMSPSWPPATEICFGCASTREKKTKQNLEVCSMSITKGPDFLGVGCVLKTTPLEKKNDQIYREIVTG